MRYWRAECGLFTCRFALTIKCVLYRHEDTVPYECDALAAYRCLPLAVALPETAEQVAATKSRLGVPSASEGDVRTVNIEGST